MGRREPRLAPTWAKGGARTARCPTLRFSLDARRCRRSIGGGHGSRGRQRRRGRRLGTAAPLGRGQPGGAASSDGVERCEDLKLRVTRMARPTHGAGLATRPDRGICVTRCSGERSATWSCAWQALAIMASSHHSETALKARYGAQMMAAASVLAGTAPDDFRRRVVARWVFVYCHEFIRWARRAKNELRGRTGMRDTVRELEQALDELEKRDWGSYEEIRHRIAAHRQTVPGPLTTSIRQTNEMWTDISEATVGILSEDARAIWNLIAGAHSIPTLEEFPPISPELKAAVDERGYEAAAVGLVSGVGSFDATRDDAVFIIQGGDLGEQNRQVVDAVRNVRTLSQLWLAVNGHEPFWRVVLAATVTEACTLHDLIYGVVAGSSSHQQPSLLELLERDDPRSGAIRVLRRGCQAIDPAALAHVRDLRNRVGAHVDDRLPLDQITRRMQSFDPAALNAVLDNAFDTLTQAAGAEPRLRPVLMFDAVLSGFALASPPEAARPYDA